MAPTIRDQDDDVPVAEVLESFGPLESGTPPGEEWLALEQALRLGGVRRGNLYVVPYIERDAPRWKAGYARLFVAGRDVPVRGTADPDGADIARVSHALLQEAVGVPTRAGAAGSACPDWTPVIDPERMLAWVCTTRYAARQRPLLRVHPRRLRVEADADLLAARITLASASTERRCTRA